MSKFEEAPEDFDKVLALIPLRCRVCRYGQLTLGLAWAFDGSTGAFWPTVESMREVCGEEDAGITDFDIRDPDTEAEIIKNEADSMLFMPLPDTDDCPFRDHSTA